MRIAPKPQPGQEITLEKLLNEPILQPVGIQIPDGRISDYENSWTLHGVSLPAGVFDIQLYKYTQGHVKACDFLDKAQKYEAKGEARAPSAVEFYAIAKFILQGNLAQTDGSEEAQEQKGLFSTAFEFVQDRWQKGVILFTQIDYSDGLDTLIHLPKTRYEEKTQANIKYWPIFWDSSRVSNSKKVFGSDWNDIINVWQQYHNITCEPKLQQLDSEDRKTYCVSVSKEGIDLRVPCDEKLVSNFAIIVVRT